MCGFAGLLALHHSGERPEREAQARAMADSLRHRGPDDSDTWSDEDVPLALSHRRLSIIDLSPDGRQPMRSASGRYVIVYNGEIYNFPALRNELVTEGALFKGRSDTEVILACIEQWGIENALHRLNGMFAFVLWDKKERRLHAVRDALGKKPLYIGWAGKTLVFGSELKALRAHPDFSAALNPDSLNLFLRYSYVPAPYCIYKGVWQLRPGCRLSLDASSLMPGTDLSMMMEAHWHHTKVLEAARANPVHGRDADITAEFEALLTECVRDRMISDVPLGAFLSGGIDSSAIVALMQKISSQPVKTYSIGFHETGFDEAVYAKKIAAHLGTEHHQMYLGGRDALSTIPMLPDMYDEPFADSSAIPTYLVSKFARQHVSVALSGDGGDEMLGGYNRHVKGPQLWAAMRFMPKPVRYFLAAGLNGISPPLWDRIIYPVPQGGLQMHKLAALLHLDSQQDIYHYLQNRWITPPTLQSSSPATVFDDPGYQPKGLSFAEKMMYWDALSYLPNDILTKVDRASMAVSLEARAPLLDKRIYEYAWRLPEKFKIRHGRGKWILREVLKKHVPAELFTRPKQGFSIPISDWLRGPLRHWTEDLLSEESIRAQGWLDPAPIRLAWEEHKSGRKNNAEKLWAVLMFQSWQDKWL